MTWDVVRSILLTGKITVLIRYSEFTRALVLCIVETGQICCRARLYNVQLCL